MKKIYLTILTLLTLNSCTPIGGNCNYQKTSGTAIVKSIEKDRCMVDFNAMQNVEAQCIGNIVVGQKYFAIYEKAMHGSCTPYFLFVYHDGVVRDNSKIFEN